MIGVNGKVVMSGCGNGRYPDNEQKRIEIVEKVFRGELTVVDAALVLGIGEQFYRIKKQGSIDVNGTRSARYRLVAGPARCSSGRS